MNKAIKFVCVALLSVFCSACGDPNTIYVSPNGNDGGKGTKNDPVQSLRVACDKAMALRQSGQFKANAPIVVQLAEGEYPMAEPMVFTSNDSGTEQSPLIIRGASNGQSTLTGGVELPPFAEEGENLWSIDLSAAPAVNVQYHQLYVNGQRATLAQTPNGFVKYKAIKMEETKTDAGDGKVLVKFTLPADAMQALQEAKVSANPEQMLLCVYHSWHHTTRHIQSISEVDSAVYFVDKSFNKDIVACAQFCFENDKAFLDNPGEWYFEQAARKLYYMPREGEVMAQSKATVANPAQLITFRGEPERPVSHIQVEGLNMAYTLYEVPENGVSQRQAASTIDAAVMADYAEQVTLSGCAVEHTGNAGIWFRMGCKNCTISKCYIHDVGACGIMLGDEKVPENEERDLTRFITVDNNILRDGGLVDATGVGVIVFQSSDNTITHNDIADYRYSGMSIGWIWNYTHSPSKRNNVSYNHIHHLAWGLLSDLAGIYTLGKSEGTELTYNVIHDVYSLGYNGCGLYTDQATSFMNIENNLVYRCKTASFNQHFGEKNFVHNNLFVNSMYEAFSGTKHEDHLSLTLTNNVVYFTTGSVVVENIWAKANTVVDKNLYWCEGDSVRFLTMDFDQWKAQSGKDANSIIANPGFADVENLDFTMSNTEALDKIGFKPFDYSQAGVYGDNNWKAKAEYGEDCEAVFQNMVAQYEKWLWADLPYMRKLYLIDNN